MNGQRCTITLLSIAVSCCVGVSIAQSQNPTRNLTGEWVEKAAGQEVKPEPPKVSPFTDVRFEDEQVIVAYDGQTYQWLELNGIKVEDIVTSSKKQFGVRWQKRISEDLVELLWGMGHQPGNMVKLRLLKLKTKQDFVVDKAPMTNENRRAIYRRRRRADEAATRIAVSIDAEASLTELIPALRKEKKLVGLATMVVVDGKVVASAVDGERKQGSGVPLEIGDRWHLGSITKSITATMVARLVESGQMQWSDSIGKVYPDASIHEDWKPVTLKELLTHTAGAPDNFSLQVRKKHPALGPECTQVRREAVLEVMAKQPAHPPGEKFAYSNVGYTIAGAMAEEATGTAWEDLVKREVFEPLKLTGAGFGPPKSPDETLEQPRGHNSTFSGKRAVDDKADNTPIMGPAGTVHMTLRDLCTYATEHLRGDLGAGKLLSAATYQRLHAPELDDYACGWVKNKPHAKLLPTMYWHNGSNTLWYALVAFVPEKNMVVAVTANDGDNSQAEAAAWDIVNVTVTPDLSHYGSLQRSGFLQRALTFFSNRSPFTGMRWQQSQPVVKVDEQWFELDSIDGIAIDKILAFSELTYKDKWRKRFAEDLVQVLVGMGHEPKDTVQLVVRPLGSSKTRTLEDVPMTKANRQLLCRQPRENKNREAQRKRVQRAAVSIDNTKLFKQRVDEFLQLARDKGGFSGAVVVARGGQPVYQGAFGFSHLESKAPNALDTPFRIASLSKQFTAAAILLLEDSGKLSIDDSVHEYLPEFAEAPYRDITIHHLLTHTSGLPRVPEDISGMLRWRSMSQAATPVDDYVRLAVKMPLKFEPGADYQYSNFGYRVLAALIARITGGEFADFMEQEIFGPLGMKETGVARVGRPPAESRIAEGFQFQILDPAGQPSFAPGEKGRNYGAGYGSGGIYASANDLLRWDRVLAGDSFLSAQQKAKLFRPVREHYACGWIVKKSGLDGRLYQGHSGANEGFFSQMMRIPEDDLVIIAVGNVAKTRKIDDVLEQLFRLCRSLPYRDL